MFNLYTIIPEGKRENQIPKEIAEKHQPKTLVLG